jgi:hypothetical protein
MQGTRTTPDEPLLHGREYDAAERLREMRARCPQQHVDLRRVKDETRLSMLYLSHARAEFEYLADGTLWMEAARSLA